MLLFNRGSVQKPDQDPKVCMRACVMSIESLHAQTHTREFGQYFMGPIKCIEGKQAAGVTDQVPKNMPALWPSSCATYGWMIHAVQYQYEQPM